jgi:hypothetical protein
MKRALLFGIDDYSRFNPLHGCVNDVNALLPLVRRNDDRSLNFEVAARTSEEDTITRTSALADLDGLLAPGADLALLYFAGHGDVAQDDLHLAMPDGVKGDAGVAFSRILTMVQRSTVPEVIVVLDCCFSGSAGGVPILGNDTAVLRKGFSVLTASRPEQFAEEYGGQGKFSFHLKGALEGGAADVLGKVTVAGVYSYLTESFGAWEQRPMFKAHLDRLHVVRQCTPSVALNDMCRITNLFSTAEFVFPLDPSYEPTAEPRDADHEAVFAILQKYRANKLLEPVGAEHMYFAAMQSKACRLTPLGRHYWGLVAKDRL